MKMYTQNEIKLLQIDKKYRNAEEDRFCLVTMPFRDLTKQDVENQAKFCVLQVLDTYRDKKINSNDANRIINKIDALLYAHDMLGSQRIIEKLNKEIIEEELRLPYFNSLVIECDDLNDDFKSAN